MLFSTPALIEFGAGGPFEAEGQLWNIEINVIFLLLRLAALSQISRISLEIILSLRSKLRLGRESLALMSSVRLCGNIR